jgi:hypothetical protein
MRSLLAGTTSEFPYCVKVTYGGAAAAGMNEPCVEHSRSTGRKAGYCAGA